MNENTDIKGKNILITGGSTGIGKATVQLLSHLGANVMFFNRDENELKKTIAEVQSSAKGKVVGIKADVALEVDVQNVFSEFDQTFGDIDILINNAAMPARSIVNSTLEEIRKVLDVNILGYLHCSKEAIKRMKKYESGHIVNIGSMSAKVCEEDADLYVSTKSVIEGFSESLRKQVNKYGIKVTVIEPGSVATEMVRENNNEKRILIEDELMLKPSDIAEAILFSITRPKRCDIICLEIRPHKQLI